MKLSYVVLYVEKVEASVEFYREAFGLEHKFTHEGGDYAEMKTGETVLAFSAHHLAKTLFTSDYQKPSLEQVPFASQITMEPEDVGNAYQKAIDGGAISLAAPEIKPWNFEVAMVRDLDGHIIELAKNLNSN